MKDAIVFVIVICAFLMPLATAEVQTLPHPVKTGLCVNLPQSYGNSTFQNISTIQFPDETIQNLNVVMTPLGGGYFNYTFCNTTQNGNYIVNGVGDVDGVTTTWVYDFTVNPLGKVFTNQQAILYFLIFFISFILFLLFVVAAIYLPSKNKSDQFTGYIIAVENAKYIRMLSWAFAYLMVMLMTYFGWMISYGYLDIPEIGSLLNFAFYGLVFATLPLFIVGVYIVVANAVRDAQIAKQLERGLRIR